MSGTRLLLPVMTLLIACSCLASAVFSMQPEWTFNVGCNPTKLCIEPLLLDEDDLPDLIVGNLLTDKLTVFYGQGNGSFVKGEEYPFTDICWIESADIDDDGDFDILARGGSFLIDSIYVYRNTGSGLLENPISYSCPSGMYETGMFAVADLNDDSCLDLVTIKPEENLYAMFGDGFGGFATALLFTDEDMVFNGFDCGDIDNDGDADIVIICWERLSVLLNDGSGSFTWNGYYGSFSNEGPVGSLDIGLLDSDTLPDIASMPGATLGEFSVFSLLGDGVGGFATCGKWIIEGFALNQTYINDYDLDGFNDALFAGDGGILLMLGDGTGNLQYDYLKIGMIQCQEAAVADFDLDGDVDFATASGSYQSDFCMEVFLNMTVQNGIGSGTSEASGGVLLLAIAENPIESVAEVHFSLPVSSITSIFAYDICGREVDVLQENYTSAGDHSVVWNTTDLPTGCYNLLLRTEYGVISCRCVKTE